MLCKGLLVYIVHKITRRKSPHILSTDIFSPSPIFSIWAWLNPPAVESHVQWADSILILVSRMLHTQRKHYNCSLSPIIIPISWWWAPEHLSEFWWGRAHPELLQQSPDWKIHKGGSTSGTLSACWLPVLFPCSAIEPACFYDIVTQPAFCYNQCFHSFQNKHVDSHTGSGRWTFSIPRCRAVCFWKEVF